MADSERAGQKYAQPFESSALAPRASRAGGLLLSAKKKEPPSGRLFLLFWRGGFMFFAAVLDNYELLRDAI